MTDDEDPRERLIRAARKYRTIEKIRDELEAAIVNALRSGMQPGEVARLAESAVTDRRIRQIAREHGIEPGKPGRKPKS